MVESFVYRFEVTCNSVAIPLTALPYANGQLDIILLIQQINPDSGNYS